MAPSALVGAARWAWNALGAAVGGLMSAVASAIRAQPWYEQLEDAGLILLAVLSGLCVCMPGLPGEVDRCIRHLVKERLCPPPPKPEPPPPAVYVKPPSSGYGPPKRSPTKKVAAKPSAAAAVDDDDAAAFARAPALLRSVTAGIGQSFGRLFTPAEAAAKAYVPLGDGAECGSTGIGASAGIGASGAAAEAAGSGNGGAFNASTASALLASRPGARVGLSVAPSAAPSAPSPPPVAPAAVAPLLLHRQKSALATSQHFSEILAQQKEARERSAKLRQEEERLRKRRLSAFDESLEGLWDSQWKHVQLHGLVTWWGTNSSRTLR